MKVVPRAGRPSCLALGTPLSETYFEMSYQKDVSDTDPNADKAGSRELYQSLSPFRVQGGRPQP